MGYRRTAVYLGRGTYAALAIFLEMEGWGAFIPRLKLPMVKMPVSDAYLHLVCSSVPTRPLPTVIVMALCLGGVDYRLPGKEIFWTNT